MMPTVAEATQDFLAQRRIAVAGVSRQKGGAHSGNGIYQRLKDRGYEVFAVNPNTDTIEDGEPCYRSLDAIPGGVDGVVISTAPTRGASGHRRLSPPRHRAGVDAPLVRGRLRLP